MAMQCTVTNSVTQQVFVGQKDADGVVCDICLQLVHLVQFLAANTNFFLSVYCMIRDVYSLVTHVPGWYLDKITKHRIHKLR